MCYPLPLELHHTHLRLLQAPDNRSEPELCGHWHLLGVLSTSADDFRCAELLARTTPLDCRPFVLHDVHPHVSDRLPALFLCQHSWCLLGKQRCCTSDTEGCCRGLENSKANRWGCRNQSSLDLPALAVFERHRGVSPIKLWKGGPEERSISRDLGLGSDHFPGYQAYIQPPILVPHWSIRMGHEEERRIPDC